MEIYYSEYSEQRVRINTRHVGKGAAVLSLVCIDIKSFTLVAQMVRESICSAGDPSSIPRLGRSPGEGNDYPLQYSCLANSTETGAWGATIHGVEKSRTRLSNFHFLSTEYWISGG